MRYVYCKQEYCDPGGYADECVFMVPQELKVNSFVAAFQRHFRCLYRDSYAFGRMYQWGDVRFSDGLVFRELVFRQ